MFPFPAPAIIRSATAILKPQDAFAILARPANQMQAAINALPFSADLLIGRDRVATGDWSFRDRLRGFDRTLASNDPKLEGAWPGYSGSNNRIEYAHKIASKFLAIGGFSHTNGTADNFDLSSLGIIGDVTVKRRDAAGDWYAWHRSLDAGKNLRLNTPDGQSAANAFISVSGTTLAFSASAPSGNYTYEAFAHDPSADGIVQCGSFTTDANGTASVNLGWLPQFINFKAASTSGYWYALDTTRGWSGSNAYIYPNTTDPEGVYSGGGSNSVGFTMASGDGLNQSASYAYRVIRSPY